MVEVEIKGFEEDLDECRPSEHAGVVQGGDTGAVCQADTGSTLDESASQTNSPMLVVNEGTVDERCSAVGIALVHAVAESHQETNLLEETLPDGRVNVQLHAVEFPIRGFGASVRERCVDM